MHAADRRVGLVAFKPLMIADMFNSFRKRRHGSPSEEQPAELTHVEDLLGDTDEPEEPAPAPEVAPAAPPATHVLSHIDELWSVPVCVVDDHGDISAVTCASARGFPALRDGVTLALRECAHSSGRLRDLSVNGWALAQAHVDPQFSYILDEAPAYRSAGRPVTLPYLMCVLRAAEVAKTAHPRLPSAPADVPARRFDVHA